MWDRTMLGQQKLIQEADAAVASEGRWPRIYERRGDAATPAVRCVHVF